MVALSDVSAVPNSGALRRLGAFLTGGGALIFFAGPATDPAKFNSAFKELAPCKLGERVDAAQDLGRAKGLVLANIDLTHPVFHLFGQPHHGDFSRAHFRSLFKVSGTQTVSVTVRVS